LVQYSEILSFIQESKAKNAAAEKAKTERKKEVF